MSFKNWLQDFIPSVIDDSQEIIDEKYSTAHEIARRLLEDKFDPTPIKAPLRGTLDIDALTFYLLMVTDRREMLFYNFLGNTIARRRSIAHKVKSGQWHSYFDDFAGKLCMKSFCASSSKRHYEVIFFDEASNYARFSDLLNFSDPKWTDKERYRKVYFDTLEEDKNYLLKLYSLLYSSSASPSIQLEIDANFEIIRHVIPNGINETIDDNATPVHDQKYYIQKLKKFIDSSFIINDKIDNSHLSLYIAYYLTYAFDNCNYLWDVNPEITKESYMKTIVKTFSEMYHKILTQKIDLMQRFRRRFIYEDRIQNAIRPFLLDNIPIELDDFSKWFNEMVFLSGYVNTHIIPL